MLVPLCPPKKNCCLIIEIKSETKKQKFFFARSNSQGNIHKYPASSIDLVLNNTASPKTYSL